ncbi:DUF2249 domain-containing protein [Mycobacterium sp. SM1]|uniref:DUF2249 domain-containing protein n=1 Tax=Mycobacterium sp. SM1 TaxID=2816243 RepID=UPI001BD06CEA|nr:DUF2249 domain-containing protein [Mycobacterium sp. SM1]MBS4729349.1 DUF2249 domain-containing protein [Mycobacterium sp. SM1]
MADTELDVRQLGKPDKHPAIFASYAALAVGQSFVLVNDHNPKHLHEEFEAGHAGSYRWEYLERGPAVWRIRITKLAATPLPRILVNTADVAAVEPGLRGVVWKLDVSDRGLDSNIIALPAGGGIDMHAGAEVDVLIHVLSGSGHLATERGAIDLIPGALLWLPRRSRRQFSAGRDGLRYLTVHQKRELLPLTPAVRRAGR